MGIKGSLISICAIVNMIWLIVFSFKNEKSCEEEEKKSCGKGKLEAFPLLTSAVASIVTLAVIIVLFIYVRMWMPAIVISIISFIFIVYGNSDNFSEFSSVAKLLEMDDQKPIFIELLVYLVTFIASMYTFFMSSFKIHIEDWIVETLMEQAGYIVLQTVLNTVCMLILICTFVELIYIFHNIIPIKSLLSKVADKITHMREVALYQKLSEKHNMQVPKSVMMLLFFPEIVRKTSLNLCSIVITCVVVIYKLGEGAAKPVLKLFEIKIKKGSHIVGTVNSLKLILNWGIITALSITYFELLGNKKSFDLITEYYSFIISIIVVPVIISTIIGYKTRDKPNRKEGSK